MTKLNLADPDDRAILKYALDLGRAGALTVGDVSDPEPPPQPIAPEARREIVALLSKLALAGAS